MNIIIRLCLRVKFFRPIDRYKFRILVFVTVFINKKDLAPTGVETRSWLLKMIYALTSSGIA